jgi:hypothetical protein
LNILEVRIDKNNVWVKKAEDENILPGS